MRINVLCEDINAEGTQMSLLFNKRSLAEKRNTAKVDMKNSCHFLRVNSMQRIFVEIRPFCFGLQAIS